MHKECVNATLNTNQAFVETPVKRPFYSSFPLRIANRRDILHDSEGVHALCVNMLLRKYHICPFPPQVCWCSRLTAVWAGPPRSYLLHWKLSVQTGDLFGWQGCFTLSTWIADLISSSRPLHYVVKACGIMNDECQLWKDKTKAI